jgi:hypothetical protein
MDKKHSEEHCFCCSEPYESFESIACVAELKKKESKPTMAGPTVMDPPFDYQRHTVVRAVLIPVCTCKKSKSTAISNRSAMIWVTQQAERNPSCIRCNQGNRKLRVRVV